MSLKNMDHVMDLTKGFNFESNFKDGELTFEGEKRVGHVIKERLNEAGALDGQVLVFDLGNQTYAVREFWWGLLKNKKKAKVQWLVKSDEVLREELRRQLTEEIDWADLEVLFKASSFLRAPHRWGEDRFSKEYWKDY